MNDINFTMCKFAGIIAEYDPFHNGHAWQLQQAKALGAQRVVERNTLFDFLRN